MFAVISSTNLFLKRYPTPEAALNHYSIKDENIIKILDDNDCAVAYYKDGTVFKSDYLNKNDNGWGVISRKMWFPKVEKQIDEYLFLYYKYHGKHIFLVSDTFNLGQKELITPFDNINSEILFYQRDVGGIVISDWFWVLDDLPENYEVTVNNQVVKVN